jgi:hypothetical protein
MPIADYNKKWEYLSTEHEVKDKDIQKILDHYRDDKSLKYIAYAVLGTYGVGKTQFLYHIHKCSIEREIMPLYFLAEDLFREVITEDRLWTPGEVYSLIENKITKIKECLSVANPSEVKNIIDPRGKVMRDSPEVIERVLEKFSGNVSENPKIILLIDELEGQYGNLQEIVQTKDRSPLREWLESKTHVKFLAFAPAGIYELGGADRDRVKRIVLPPADVKYIRENLVKDAGKSNSCWWLSRGKARQLFKSADILNKVEDTDDASRISRIIKQEFDSIGQPPTEVPPAITDKILPHKIPFLLRLSPVAGEKGRRYIIDTKKLRTGEFAEKLIEAFGISNDNALLISEYFKKTLHALSDDKWIVYIDDDDLPELFCLVLDHFLEYEHGDPELSKTFGEILSLYERSKKESAAIYGIIGRLWELKETEYRLPLTINEIREAFPFPTMNPIVKNYVPEEMKKKWEGQGLPLWKWKEGNISILFFASARDLKAYSEIDEFLSLSLPDGNGVLCLLPSDEEITEGKIPLFKWLEENDKLRVIKLQPLLTDFLLSASGELSDIPGDFQETLGDFKENKEDILLSRKSEIYEKALEDTIKDEMLRPQIYCNETPPDAGIVWGKGYIERNVDVKGLALAFSKLKPGERNILADLRELFKGGKDERGVGDLHGILPSRGGYSTMVNDLLPRLGRKKVLKDSEPIARLRNYWRENEKTTLENLARILRLEDFLKLHPEENINRLLEALWRVTRGEFELEEEEIDIITDKLQKDIILTLKMCQELEKMVSDFGLSGIDFGDYEQLVKSLPSFEKLLEILDKSATVSPLVKSIILLLAENLEDIDSDIRELGNLCNNTKRALEDLKESAETLEKNFSEYKRAVKFVGISKKDLKGMIDEQTKMDGTLEIEKIEEEANERKEYLDTVSARLADLDDKLNQLQGTLSQIKGGT